MKRARQDFGDTRCIVNLGGPFGGLSKDRTVVHFLKSFAFAHAALDLSDRPTLRLALGAFLTERMGLGGATPISRAYSSVAGSALIVRIIRFSGIASVTTIRSLDGVKWSKITSSTG